MCDVNQLETHHFHAFRMCTQSEFCGSRKHDLCCLQSQHLWEVNCCHEIDFNCMKVLLTVNLIRAANSVLNAVE